MIEESASPGRSRAGEIRATLVGVLAILLWSSLALLAALAKGLPPFELLSASFAVAFLGSLLLLGWRGRKGFAALRQPWQAWLLAFAGIFLYHALYFFALDAAPPAEASLINYLWPLLIVLLAGLATGERLRPAMLAGALLGFAGTVVIILQDAPGSAADGERRLAGYAAAFACAFVWSGYSVANRRFRAVPSALIGGVCGLVAAAGWLLHLGLESTVMPDMRQGAAILALGLGPVGLAFFAWDHATKHGRLALLGTLSYAAPLLSTLLLIVFGAAQASVGLLAAALLIVSGAAVATFAGERR